MQNFLKKTSFVVAGLGILGFIGYYVLPILSTIVWNTFNFGVALGFDTK